jgi:hypothetical protein
MGGSAENDLKFEVPKVLEMPKVPEEFKRFDESFFKMSRGKYFTGHFLL